MKIWTSWRPVHMSLDTMCCLLKLDLSGRGDMRVPVLYLVTQMHSPLLYHLTRNLLIWCGIMSEEISLITITGNMYGEIIYLCHSMFVCMLIEQDKDSLGLSQNGFIGVAIRQPSTHNWCALIVIQHSKYFISISFCGGHRYYLNCRYIFGYLCSRLCLQSKSITASDKGFS